MGADRPEFQIYSPRERTIWLKRFIVETWIKYERKRVFIIHKQPTQHSCQELLRTKSNTALPVWNLHLPLPVVQVRYIQGPESLENSFRRPKRNQGFLNKQWCYQCYQQTSIIGITKNVCGSVQFSRSVTSDSLRPHEPQQARPPCPSPTPRVHPNLCPLSRWCHPTISSSVIPFSSCPQSFPTSGAFQMSQLFASGVQSTGVSASTSVLPMNTQDWSPLGWTSWISLQSKRLPRVFSITIVQKYQFFGVQLSSSSNSHIHTWSVENP